MDSIMIENITEASDETLVQAIVKLQAEQQARIRRTNKQIISQFKAALNKMLDSNITCYINHFDDTIYIDDKSVFHFYDD